MGNLGNLSYSQVSSPDQIEYQVKAGFIFNFLTFVSWPGEIISNSGSWKIGVMADPAVIRLIRKTLTGKSVDGRPVEITRFQPEMESEGYHVIFITDNFTNSYAEFAAKLAESPVLVIGENKDFARNHGIIGFVKKKENLRLEINPARAKRAGLVISGKLASLSELVEDRE